MTDHMKTLSRMIEKADRAYKRAFAECTRYARNGNIPSAEELKKRQRKMKLKLSEWTALVAAERAMEKVS